MPAPFKARVRVLLVVAALHACARVDVAAAQAAEELFRDGTALWDAKNYTGAQVPYLRAATEFNHAAAQSQLGRLHFFGLGVAANKTEGVRWYTLASTQGYDLAHINLGYAFERGEGVPAADEDEAVRLFTLGAARGQKRGLYNLGYAHSNGQGPLAVGKPVALGFYERAARQGHRTTQYLAAALLYNMSQYMRCPKGNLSDYTTLWKDNDCLMTDRVLIPFMGHTICTKAWRFTEWTRWNATSLAPDHTQAGLVGVELYSHPDAQGMGYSFDAYENTNEATANPDVVAKLRSLLHQAIANQTRIRSFGVL